MLMCKFERRVMSQGLRGADLWSNTAYWIQNASAESASKPLQLTRGAQQARPGPGSLTHTGTRHLRILSYSVRCLHWRRGIKKGCAGHMHSSK